MTIVSPQDGHLLELSWSTLINASGNVYAYKSKGRSGCIYLHRVILDAQKGIEVDHKNNNGLDNRRINLRLASKSQNAANKRNYKKTGYKGVFHITDRKLAKPFRAYLCSNGKKKVIGYFATAQEASAAYYAEAIAVFGEFARSK